ncbi:spore coat protein U domain-containing protein [Sphingomonas sp. XXL09]|uniref:spore coat protein U domain-containing protein n=1 Tax=Sphingomonas sp. XXL09 TaxID=3457787 RepID=UPI00406BA58D
MNPLLPLRRLILGVIAMLCAAIVASPAAAAGCTVSTSLAPAIGPYSPAAIKAAAVPAQKTRAGLTCDTSIIVLLGGNYIRGTLNTTNGLKLTRSGGGTIGYTTSADANGTYPFTPGVPLDFMQNNLLNVLGLLGGSTADLPLYLKLTGGTTPAAGTYTDRITIDWSWYICPVYAAGVCAGTPNAGTGRSTIDVTLTVAAQNATMTMTTVTSWDPVNGTSNPRDLPGARRRVSVAMSNPDIVPLDAGTIGLVLPTPTRAVVALDGDGTASSTVVGLTDGSPASGVTLRYGGPGDTTDDVDFSADGGATWTYVPVAGNIASEAAVTHVRLRPRGAMAKQSSFTVSLPYLLR